MLISNALQEFITMVEILTPDCMLWSCHVRVSEWIHIYKCLKDRKDYSWQKLNAFSVISTFQNSLKIKKVELCEKDLIEKDLYDVLKSMQNDKSPGTIH